ncbi:MAG: hypothetical protein CMQ30_09075 [Gammaproteobacteria bacterium]|nr:hypothetical protein [Gammaproteobacteria bacterium]
MADEIDRSVEPKLGTDDKKKDGKKATELSPGVRVRARSKKDVQSKKKTSDSPKKVSPKASQVKKTSQEKVEKPSPKSEVNKLDTSALEMKLEGVDSKLSNLSDELVNTVRAMEDSGSSLNEQEHNFLESINEFKIYKQEQQKISTVVLLSSFFGVLVAVGFLIFAVFNFGSKNDLFDSATSALTTRIADMDAGLVSFEAARSQLAVLQEQIEVLELRIEESQMSYDNTEQDIQGQLLNYSQELSQELADQTANLRENLARLDDRFSIFNAQILDFGDVLEESENTIGEIGEEAKSLTELREVMDALLTLERERYYEAINGEVSQSRQTGVGTEGSSPNGMPTFNRYYNR